MCESKVLRAQRLDENFDAFGFRVGTDDRRPEVPPIPKTHIEKVLANVYNKAGILNAFRVFCKNLGFLDLKVSDFEYFGQKYVLKLILLLCTHLIILRI